MPRLLQPRESDIGRAPSDLLAMKTVGLLFLAVSLTACTSTPTAPIAWNREDLVGRTLVLVDERVVETLRLTPDGNVIASTGKRGGPIAAPVWKWKIENEQLVIFDQTQQYRQLTLLRKAPREFVVRTKWGRVLVYEVRR